MKLKKDLFLSMFFKKKEIAKIKKIDKMHRKNIMPSKKLNRYITRFRIKSYLLFLILSVLVILGAYFLNKYNILIKDNSFNDLTLLGLRVIPVLFLILIVLELFVIYNRIYDIDGTLFNKQIKKCFLISFVYFFLIIIFSIIVALTTKNKGFIKTDILIIMLACFYIIKCIMDLISYAKMYVKAKI